MKRVIIILLIVIAAAGISVVGYQYAKPVNEAPSLAEDPSVEIVPVGRETLLDTVDATGRIEPKAEVDMNFEIGGVVEEVPVERGQNITAGTGSIPTTWSLRSSGLRLTWPNRRRSWNDCLSRNWPKKSPQLEPT